MPKIALVTVLFQSDDVLEGFIRSLSIQTFKDYHLYILDNTPSQQTDEILTKLIEKFPISSYTHIKNDKNIGVAAGNNQGIEFALKDGSTHTLLLNNDIEFDNINLLGEFYNTAIKNNESFIIPKILYFDSRKIWMAGGELLKWIGGNRHIGTGDREEMHNEAKYFDYAPTCFMLIKNDIFREIGIMDEKYFVYYDDLDFIWRSNKAGHKIYYIPNLVVLHKVSSSTGGQESLFAVYYTTRNMIYFIRKNYNGVLYFCALSYSLVRRGIKCLFSNKQKRKKIKEGIRDGWHL